MKDVMCTMVTKKRNMKVILIVSILFASLQASAQYDKQLDKLREIVSVLQKSGNFSKDVVVTCQEDFVCYCMPFILDSGPKQQVIFSSKDTLCLIELNVKLQVQSLVFQELRDPFTAEKKLLQIIDSKKYTKSWCNGLIYPNFVPHVYSFESKDVCVVYVITHKFSSVHVAFLVKVYC